MKSLQALPNFVDMRNSLPKARNYIARNQKLRTRVWHHSLTLSHLGGSDAASFAKFHIEGNGWPGVAYHLIIEPKNIVNTPKGKRARIVWAHNFDRRSYHAGNANDYAIGICVAGDYRNEDLKDYVKATIDEVQQALVKDGYGNEDKSHHEMPGYSWKACCVFDYNRAFRFLDGNAPVTPAPATYKIQEGDTLWNLANNLDGISLADLLEANPGINPANLQIGQLIKLGDAKGAEVEAEESKPAPPISAITPSVKVGSRVVLKTSADKYATGEVIPSSVKGKQYTALQLKSGRVLLKEILSWVHLSDVSASSVSRPSPAPVSLKPGARVKLENNATHYATGERIPDSVSGNTYTILQVGTNRVLLKEIFSWVKTSDLEGVGSAPAKPAPAKVAKVGSKVVLNNSATRYSTGESIPSSVKGRTYTIQQVKSDRVLLKEILSWVSKGDITVK